MNKKLIPYFLYFYTALIALFILSIMIKKIRRDRNKTALDTNANLRAFLLMIRVGEGTSGENGYRTLFGGSLFSDYSKHPNKVITKGGYSSTAAGAYQFLYKTWEGVRSKLGLPDFSPESQDLGAIELLRQRKVYDFVIQGKIEEAINQGANKEWASLPNSPYGQPTKTMAQVINYYKQYGGSLA